MSQSKLTLAVKMLDSNQKKDLLAFMHMPSNKLSDRDKELFSSFLNIDLEKLENVEAFWDTSLVEKEKKNRNQLKNRLLGTLERYLSLHALETVPTIASTMVARKYMESGLWKHGKFWIKKIRSILDSRVDRSLDNHLIHFWLTELEVNATKNNRVKTSKLLEMDQSIREYYQINRIRLHCEGLNRKGILELDQDMDKILEQISPENSSEESMLYYHISKMLFEKDVESYEFIRHFLSKEKAFFSKKYRKEIYEYLMNFCIRKINHGEKYYAEIYLELIGVLKEEGLLLDMGKLGIPRFKNCVVACIIADKPGWMDQFTAEYTNLLEESNRFNREPFLNFNRALIELHRGNLKKSWELLDAFKQSGMYLKDVYYKIACDKLLLKIYYQKGENRLIKSQVGGIKKYIKINGKIKKGRQKPHLLFINCLQKLQNGEIFDLETLKNDLLILDYNWLKNVLIQQGATFVNINHL